MDTVKTEYRPLISLSDLIIQVDKALFGSNDNDIPAIVLLAQFNIEVMGFVKLLDSEISIEMFEGEKPLISGGQWENDKFFIIKKDDEEKVLFRKLANGETQSYGSKVSDLIGYDLLFLYHKQIQNG